MFYGTLDKEGKRAFQGVAKLVSHRREDGKIAQGTGYWGIKEGSEPKPDFSKLAAVFERVQTGADLYVAGFHEFDSWEADVVKSVLESFFMAVWKKKLQVKVGRTTVNASSLAKLIAKHYAEPEPRFFADEYYNVLTSEESIVFEEPDFMGYGAVRLQLLEGKDFKKRVAMFRRSGMKIFDKGSFHTPVHFAGVLTAEGQKLDALLRTMEPPSHDDWLPDRVDSPAERKVLKGLLQWVRDRVRELGGLDTATELDAVGMSEFLPDDLDEAGTGSQESSEEVEQEPAAELVMRLRPVSRPIARHEEESGGSEEDGEGDEPGGSEQGGSGPGGDEGGEIVRAGVRSTPEPGRRVEFESVRGYCAKPSEGRYRFLLDPAASESVRFQVSIVGEVGSERARVARYRINGGPEEDAAARQLLGPVQLVKDQRAVLDIVLEDPIRCALEVAAYAD